MTRDAEVVHGCALLETLHDGSRSLVHRCRRLSDGATLILKRSPLGSTGAERAQALIFERDILRRLGNCGAAIGLRGFDVENNRSALLLEDIHGRALSTLGLMGKLEPRGWLELARRLTRLLADIHDEGVVHNDVNTANIVVDPTHEVIKVIDFASARPLDEGAAPSSLRALHGSVAYMSPEQTGRLDRPVDPRSDLYSLGVVLFELLTGKLPFPYTDPRQLVHAHLAREPPRASDFVAGVPAVFDEILAKLLAKDPERRHPSALALESDLEQAGLTSLGERAKQRPSTPRRVGGMLLSHHTYGHETVLDRILAAHEASGDHARAVILVGPAGSGKSTVARQFAQHERRRHALFASGRFEAAGSGPPHAAISQIAASLSTQLLSEGDARMLPWKRTLAENLGGTARVLMAFCPPLRHLLPDVEPRQISPGQTRTQLAQALITLLDQASTLRQAPLSVFVDDAQLATDESLDLLTDIAAGCRGSPILFLFAHRTEDASAPRLNALVSQLRGADLRAEEIELPPLSVAAVKALITSSLPQAAPAAEELAEVVTERTRGNPFFVRTFLEALSAEGFLDEVHSFDLARINRLGVTANVAELLVEGLARLPRETRDVLAVGANIGTIFEIDILRACVEHDVEMALSTATAFQVVLPVAPEETVSDSVPSPRRFRFAHELVRRELLARLDADARERLHLRIGRVLLQLSERTHLGSRVFEIARHLNEARAKIASAAERRELAELNLEAAKSALERAAAVEALDFARIGVELLTHAEWSSRYDLAKELHVVACDAAFESANHEALASIAPAMLAEARTEVEASRVHWLQGRVLQARSQSAEAIRTFCTALSRLGVDLDLTPTPELIAVERSKTQEALAAIGIESLSKLPRSNSEVHTAAAEFLSKLIFFAYSDVSSLLPIVICRLVRLSIEHGNTAETANGLTFYGLLLALDGDRQGAVRYANAALETAHAFGDPTNLSQTYLYASYLLLHWRVPLADLVEPLGDAYRYGLASGSPLNTACSATTLCICRFWAGHELTRLDRDMHDYRKVVVRFRQLRILNWHEIWMQVIENLRDGSSRPTELAGRFYEEATRYPEHVRLNDKTAIFNLNVARTLVAFLFGDKETALEYSARNRHIPPLFSCSIWAVPVAFLDALCLLAACGDSGDPRRAELLVLAEERVRQLAMYVPDNPREIEAKRCLLAAELARVQGDFETSRRCYAQAMESSAGSGSSLDEAIASEASGRFELGRREVGVARQHLRAAHRAYLRWGALAKVRALEAEFPEIFRPTTVSRGEGAWSLSGAGADFDFLDMASCLDASRALSSEIKLDGLLKKLMTLLVETAGAQTGCLLMKRNDRWVVEVAQSAEGGTVSILESLPLHAALACGLGSLDEGIVNYVAGTGESVLLQNERSGSISPHTLRAAWTAEGSVLCFAVKLQGETLAIVYLENRLTRRAFTRGALRVLEMLSAQAAVSLENARLYAQLEDRVQLRTRELSAKKDELEATLRRLTDIQQKLLTHEKLSGLATIAGGLAHEIKNPLNFISNFAEGAVETAEELVREVEIDIARFRPEKQQTLHALLDGLRLDVGKVVEHANRANRLVDRMSRYPGRKTEPRRTDLNELVLEGLGAAIPAPAGSTEGEVSVVTELDSVPVMAMLVAEDIVQVIVNLVTNAVYSVRQKRANRPEGYRPLVRVSTRAVGANVELRVEDNGVGVPAALRQDIFVHFFTTKPAGQGLGLSLVHETVKSHGGHVRLESAEGEYAEFVISLPVHFLPQSEITRPPESQPPSDRRE